MILVCLKIVYTSKIVVSGRENDDAHPAGCTPELIAGEWGCENKWVLFVDEFENKVAAWFSLRFWALSFGPVPVRLACNLGHLFLQMVAVGAPNAIAKHE